MLTLVSKDVPTRHHHGEIPRTAHPAGAELLQHLYTSAHRAGNEQNELGGCDVVGIMKMWWVGSITGVAVEECGIFRKDRVERWGREWPLMWESCWGAWGSAWGWMRNQLGAHGFKERTEKGDIIASVCYMCPDSEEAADQGLCRQVRAASSFQALVLTWDFNHPNICSHSCKMAVH